MASPVTHTTVLSTSDKLPIVMLVTAEALTIVQSKLPRLVEFGVIGVPTFTLERTQDRKVRVSIVLLYEFMCSI